jgi:hypothetical protein
MRRIGRWQPSIGQQLRCRWSRQELKYDDASWHSSGDFPSDLPPEAAATHTGMFLAWALLSGFGSELHTREFADELHKLRSRRITPGKYLLDVVDGKLTDEDLTDEGNEFTKAYFDFKTGMYPLDYDGHVTADLPSIYHAPDSWETFDRLQPVLDMRFDEWRLGTLPTRRQRR